MSFRYVFLARGMRSSRESPHATSCRALLHALADRGHDVVLLEPEDDAPSDQELSVLAYTYRSLTELFDRHASLVREADLVVVGSGLPDGVSVGRWALELCSQRIAFYDLDTPVTLRGLEGRRCPYLSPVLVSRYPLYLTAANGSTLDVLRRGYDAPWVRPLLPCFDPEVHFPEHAQPRWDVGHLTSPEEARGPELLADAARGAPAGRFVVAGAHDPTWPANVEAYGDLAPPEHRRFYGEQRFTLVVGRSARPAGWCAPSARLFEAAACAAAIVSEPWPGLEELFRPGSEIFFARNAADLVRLVRELPEADRSAVGAAARRRVLAEHTASSRAEALERYTRELLDRRLRRSRVDIHGEQA